MFKNFLFKLVKWIIRKYFYEGLNPVYGKEEYETKVIAWKWKWFR